MTSRDCGKPFEAERELRSATGSYYKKPGTRTEKCGRLKAHAGDCGLRYCRQVVVVGGARIHCRVEKNLAGERLHVTTSDGVLAASPRAANTLWIRAEDLR